MFDILSDLLKEIYTNCAEFMQEQIVGMYKYAFNAETYLSDYVNNFGAIYKLIYQYAFYFLIIKFLIKGIETYYLYTDGDPDTSPEILLTSFFKAGILSICFGELYDIFIGVVKEILDKIMKISQVSAENLQLQEIDFSTFFVLLSATLYIILIFIMSLMMRVTGLQLLILRLGFSFASIGMLDADGGSFKPYIKLYVQIALTVIIQTFLMNLSFCMLMNGDAFYAVACVLMAFFTPAFLSQFVMQGGQTGQKITSGLMAVSSLKRIIS